LNPLASLLVIDRLEVGPVAVEKNRLTAPYTVIKDGTNSSIDFAYRFEEDVFDPDDPASRNMACLMAAQVALNYGLFCKQIVFHGEFDSVDRKFLSEMAANTAREIYVKKLLEPNPFLTPATRVPTIKQDDYLQAELVFPDAEPKVAAAAGEPFLAGASERMAVLSSGGKDSLLSYGLLKEMGFETHSVFLNESGRHWYTALNAYRFLRDTQPDTNARVWTSSDRVFSWMLRHLPFVREDFARLRSDEYPIRLWTVGVFLFGALPILKKRSIGHLVIGDEYDTSRRVKHEGIPHYDGLYDQSRFFDQRLSRYYRRKNWPFVQYSLLRPLSELLIEKTLIERYPDLHQHQVSCHATHLEGERAVPCGRCEKCRRIVGMHLALGADPAACGYTDENIKECVDALGQRGAQGEPASARQLAWMLVSKGLIDEATPFGATAREHPEILQLRFHHKASPIDAIPTLLRRPLYAILLKHANRAVERRDRQWIAFEPLGQTPGVVVRSSYLLGELTWPLAKERLKTTDTALLPVGASEQHGAHLPLDTDTWDATYLADEVARRCSDPKPLVLPAIAYGVSYHHEEFPGTLSISPETLSRMVYEIGMSAARHGVIKLIIINGHGGNGPTLQYAAQMINRDAHIFTCVDSGETSDADIADITETPNDVHAGEVETSTALATRPELVDMSLAKKAVPRFSSRYLDFSSRLRIEWYAHTGKLSKSGVLGDPTKASREKGERYWELMIGHLVNFVERIKGMSLAEIHERRQ
jgi:creatinine amidohydrolase/Fe(II)-dependent formamide hydrolase-like protein